MTVNFHFLATFSVLVVCLETYVVKCEWTEEVTFKESLNYDSKVAVSPAFLSPSFV